MANDISVSNSNKNNTDNRVTKSNQLIRSARYRLTITQQKMLLYIMSAINLSDQPDHIYSFDIKSFCQANGLKVSAGGYYYRALKRQLESIDSYQAWIPTDDQGTIERFRWFDTIKIDPKHGCVDLSFHRSVRPYLFGLTSNFTSYSREELRFFRCKYSFRLYEYLLSYLLEHNLAASSVTLTLDPISVSELQDILDASTKVVGVDIKTNAEVTKPIFINFKDFRVNALDKAVNEINMYTNLHIEYALKMTKNKTSHVSFSIRSKDLFELMDKQNRLDASTSND